VPWAWTVENWELRVEKKASVRMANSLFFMIPLAVDSPC